MPAEYYVRQLRDWKGAAEVADLDPSGLAFYGEPLREDARSGPGPLGDRVAIAAYLGRRDGFEQALADFATLYADENQRDFEALKQAGRPDASR